MEDSKAKYYCYLCGSEINDSNRTDEHIILNAVGGHLHSRTIICKKCNSELGEKSDSVLAEDLSYFTDMLQVNRNRKSGHNQIMTDKDGHEIIVENAGKKLRLRKPYKQVTTDGDKTEIMLSVRTKEELKGLLNGLVKERKLNQQQADEIVAKAQVTKHNSPLSKRLCVSQEAFPSIIKSAVNFYMDKTHDYDTIKHLVPIIKGIEDTKGAIYLYILKTLPYTVGTNQVIHMIHIEGSKDTELLYAYMEYFSVYPYVVVLNDNYQKDEPINITYAFDTIESKEIQCDFSMPLSLSDLLDFHNMPHEEYCKEYLPCIENRANRIMAIWQEKQDKEELHDAINNAFAKFPDGCVLDESMVKSISDDMVSFFLKLIQRGKWKK
ncbi:MAG: HNH endonuclease [Bacteroidales bacterium]|nr:HNH endonuclease [Bacteroidales bacterium]